MNILTFCIKDKEIIFVLSYVEIIIIILFFMLLLYKKILLVLDCYKSFFRYLFVLILACK